MNVKMIIAVQFALAAMLSQLKSALTTEALKLLKKTQTHLTEKGKS